MGWEAHRVSGPTPQWGEGTERLYDAAEGAPVAPDQARALRDGSRWIAQREDHVARRRELRAVVASGSEAAGLRVEREGPAAAQLRCVSDQRRRQRAGAGDLQRDVRRVPDVFSRRQAPGLRVQPEREDGRRDERLYRRLGRLSLFCLFFFFNGRFDLPVGERLRAGTDIGDIRVDTRGKIGGLGAALAVGEARGLIIALGNARLLALTFVRGRS